MFGVMDSGLGLLLDGASVLGSGLAARAGVGTAGVRVGDKRLANNRGTILVVDYSPNTNHHHTHGTF